MIWTLKELRALAVRGNMLVGSLSVQTLRKSRFLKHKVKYFTRALRFSSTKSLLKQARKVFVVRSHANSRWITLVTKHTNPQIPFCFNCSSYLWVLYRDGAAKSMPTFLKGLDAVSATNPSTAQPQLWV